MEKIDKRLVSAFMKERDKFSHKGDYGHALLIAGSLGKGGAAVLSARGVLRAGAGLLTVHIPGRLNDILQSSVPEAMCTLDANDNHLSVLPSLEGFNAVGAGPGLGLAPETGSLVSDLIESCRVPLVLDADALNIVASRPELLARMRRDTILTPHPGEFDRFAGPHSTREERIASQKKISRKYGVIIVLKGAGTTISLPDGEIFENTTGNPGMATGGSGDVLTGIILGMLAQSYTPAQAAIAGVFFHGLAGDFAAGSKGERSIIATDIVESLPLAFK